MRRLTAEGGGSSPVQADSIRAASWQDLSAPAEASSPTCEHEPETVGRDLCGEPRSVVTGQLPLSGELGKLLGCQIGAVMIRL